MNSNATPIEEFNSLIELMEYFDSEKKCIEYYQYQRWQGKPTCPHCECEKVYCFSDGKRFKCASCKKQFTVRIGTIFEDSNISLKKWFIAIYLVLNHKTGISSYQLARDIKVTQATGWFILHRIRFGLGINESKEDLDGTVQLDETFVGGKNKNRHKDKKVEKCQGRAFKDKTPVMGMLQQAEYHIVERPSKTNEFKIVKERVITKQSVARLRVIPNTQAATLQPIIWANVKKSCKLVSDEWMGYAGLNNLYEHNIVDHRAKQYVNEAGQTTNALEGLWQGFKGTFMICRHMSRKHLQHYANEVQYRYNTKHMNQHGRITLALSMTKHSLKYKDLIKKAA